MFSYPVIHIIYIQLILKRRNRLIHQGIRPWQVFQKLVENLLVALGAAVKSII